MKKINYDDPLLKTAKIRGYIPNKNEWVRWEKFSHTHFVGVWLRKYPNRIKELDILSSICEHSPEFEDLTDLTLEIFVERLTDSLCSSSVNTACARLKAVLNTPYDDIKIPSKNYNKILKAKKEPSVNVYLNEDEINALEMVETSNFNEEYVKDVFLISAYTGARHSDSIRMTEDNINPDTNSLSYVSLKTKIKATIPVHRNLRKHIGKYGEDIGMADSTFNMIIRRLCQRAGINSIVKVFKQGKEKSGEKYNFVSSHTARRSFATCLALRSVDIAVICSMMGHDSNIDMTLRYIMEMPTYDEKAIDFFS